MQEEAEDTSTTRVALKYGLYIGLALIIYSFLTLSLNLGESLLVGLSGFVIIIAGAVLGMQDFKRKMGFITFGQGLGLGLLAITIGGLMDAGFQSVYTSLNPEFIQKTREQAIKAYEEGGIPDEQIEAMEPILNFLFSPGGVFIANAISYFIIGLIISLISAAFLRKNPPIFD